MAFEAQDGLTREQKAYRAQLRRYMKDLGVGENGRALRDYLGFMLYEFRHGNDTATGDALLKNQGGIAVCLQILEDMQPVAPERDPKIADPRTHEERMASPDTGY
jgi:hypothetical protein